MTSSWAAEHECITRQMLSAGNGFDSRGLLLLATCLVSIQPHKTATRLFCTPRTKNQKLAITNGSFSTEQYNWRHSVLWNLATLYFLPSQISYLVKSLSPTTSTFQCPIVPIWQRAHRYHCCPLCKMSKLLDNWVTHCGQIYHARFELTLYVLNFSEGT